MYTILLLHFRNFYFLGHIVPLLILFLLPYALPNSSPEPKKSVVDVTYELNLDPTLKSTTTTTAPSEKENSTVKKTA